MATLLSEFKEIKPKNGYRNDFGGRVYNAVVWPEKLVEHPTAEIFFGQSYFEVLSSAWEINDEFVPVYANGFIKSSLDLGLDTGNLALAQESVVHDFKRVIAKLMTKYVLDVNSWIVSKEKGLPTFDRFLLDQNGNGMVQAKFWVKIRSQNKDFQT